MEMRGKDRIMIVTIMIVIVMVMITMALMTVMMQSSRQFSSDCLEGE